MSLSASLLRHQGPQLRSLLQAGLASLPGQVPGGSPADVPVPGRTYTTTVRPPKELVASYLAFLGSDPSAWKGRIPPHLFCWWALPVMGQTIADLPLNPSSVINGGATLTLKRPLPSGVPLRVSAQLASIDHDERRTLVSQRITTGPTDDPEACEFETRLFFPGKRRAGRKGPRPAPVTVPMAARELASRKLSAQAGRDFAVITGDFNPIHWIPAAGRAAGFGGCILHGYATLAFGFEALVRARLSGQADRVQSFDARFARPVRLPGRIRAFDAGQGSLHVAPHPGAPSALIGSYTLTPTETP